jgi:squalene cyclase
MKSSAILAGVLVALAALLALPAGARADELPKEYRESVNKGLEWLVKQQHSDGHWEAAGAQYPLTMTGLSGMALLMEGSTIREGKYSANIRKAVDWLIARSMPNGMLGNPNIPGEAGRYMYGHGFALLFLSSVYGEEDEGDRRRKLEDVLTRAVQFTGKAQTTRGGWGYISAADGSDFDEGSVTITQVQAVRAARNAGISVPKEIIDKAVKYLKDSTGSDGGVIYSLANGGGGPGRPALTAAAIACGFSAGEYGSKEVAGWFKYVQQQVPLQLGGVGRFGHDEYTHYYLAQAIYVLGDEGWGKMFPKDKDGLSWSKYKKATFDSIVRAQGADGGWTGGMIGPVFISAIHLSILQLDNAALPIYQR